MSVSLSSCLWTACLSCLYWRNDCMVVCQGCVCHRKTKLFWMNVRDDECNNSGLGVPQIVGYPRLIYHSATTYAVVLRSEIAVKGNGSEARKTHSHRPQIKMVVFSCSLSSQLRYCVASFVSTGAFGILTSLQLKPQYSASTLTIAGICSMTRVKEKSRV